MKEPAPRSSAAMAWERASMAAAVFAVSPHGLGGIVLQAQPGPARDAWLDLIQGILPADIPVRRMPPGIDDSRLLGGLDLAATLHAGRPALERGLLASADGGVVIIPMAERLTPGMAGKLAAVLDTGESLMERDGMTRRLPANIAVIMLDESESDSESEAPPTSLCDRMAITVDLAGLSYRDISLPPWGAHDIAEARTRLRRVMIDDGAIDALCATASALGISSLRRPLHAVRVALALAALDGRSDVTEPDLRQAVELALLPYATQMPAPPEEQQQDTPPPPPEPKPEQLQESPETAARDQADDETQSDKPTPAPDADTEIETAAIATILPPDLLEGLAVRLRSRNGAMQSRGGRKGPDIAGGRRGRPVGSRRGRPGGGHRLDLLATLRAAAPWQPLRRVEQAARTGILVRPDDFHVTRIKSVAETTTIFCVDASGSAALTRLAEAKGAAELLLASCYIRRDEVGVIAFKGNRAEILLPPTRSLARAKRSLTGMPGGGGTPLATGIRAAATLAEAERRRGRLAMVVLMTDGNANISLDGSAGRDGAMADAMTAARSFRRAGIASLMIDMSLRGTDKARVIAEAMGADYLYMPRKDAQSLSRAALEGVDILSGRVA